MNTLREKAIAYALNEVFSTMPCTLNDEVRLELLRDGTTELFIYSDKYDHLSYSEADRIVEQLADAFEAGHKVRQQTADALALEWAMDQVFVEMPSDDIAESFERLVEDDGDMEGFVLSHLYNHIAGAASAVNAVETEQRAFASYVKRLIT